MGLSVFATALADPAPITLYQRSLPESRLLEGQGYVDLEWILERARSQGGLELGVTCRGALPHHGIEAIRFSIASSLRLDWEQVYASPNAQPCRAVVSVNSAIAQRLRPEDRLRATYRFLDDDRRLKTGVVDDIAFPFFVDVIDALYPTSSILPHPRARSLAAGPGWLAIGTAGGLSFIEDPLGASRLQYIETWLPRDGLPSLDVRWIAGSQRALDATLADARTSQVWLYTSKGPCVRRSSTERRRGTLECGDAQQEGAWGPLTVAGSCAWTTGPGAGGEGSVVRAFGWDPIRGVQEAEKLLSDATERVHTQGMGWTLHGAQLRAWAIADGRVTVYDLHRELGEPHPGCGQLQPLADAPLSDLLTRPDGAPASLQEPLVLASDGPRLWVSTWEGVACLTVTGHDITRCPGSAALQRPAAFDSFDAVAALGSELWIADQQRGLRRLVSSAGEPPRWEAVLGPEGEEITAVTELKVDEASAAERGGGATAMWVASEQGILHCAVGADGARCRALPTRQAGIESRWMTAALKGDGRRLWMGDSRGGIHLLDLSDRIMVRLETLVPGLRLAPISGGAGAGAQPRQAVVDVEGSGAVEALADLGDDLLLVGLDWGLAAVAVDGLPRALLYRAFRLSPGGKRFPIDRPLKVHTLKPLPSGAVLVGTSQGLGVVSGAPRWDAEPPVLDLIPDPSDLGGGSSDSRAVYAVEVDPEGRLWLGTDQGLQCLQSIEAQAPLAVGQPCVFRAKGGTSPSPDALGDVRSLLLSGGRLYAGTGRGELYDLTLPAAGAELAGPRLRAVFTDAGPVLSGWPEGEEAVTGAAIASLGEDRRGGLWALTSRQGVVRAFRQDDREGWIGPFGPEHGLRSATREGAPHFILKDNNHGDLWIDGAWTWFAPEGCPPEMAQRRLYALWALVVLTLAIGLVGVKRWTDAGEWRGQALRFVFKTLARGLGFLAVPAALLKFVEPALSWDPRLASWLPFLAGIVAPVGGFIIALWALGRYKDVPARLRWAVNASALVIALAYGVFFILAPQIQIFAHSAGQGALLEQATCAVDLRYYALGRWLPMGLLASLLPLSILMADAFSRSIADPPKRAAES